MSQEDFTATKPFLARKEDYERVNEQVSWWLKRFLAVIAKGRLYHPVVRNTLLEIARDLALVVQFEVTVKHWDEWVAFGKLPELLLCMDPEQVSTLRLGPVNELTEEFRQRNVWPREQYVIKLPFQAFDLPKED
jgi:hypothetical protein